MYKSFYPENIIYPFNTFPRRVNGLVFLLIMVWLVWIKGKIVILLLLGFRQRLKKNVSLMFMCTSTYPERHHLPIYHFTKWDKWFRSLVKLKGKMVKEKKNSLMYTLYPHKHHIPIHHFTKSGKWFDFLKEKGKMVIYLGKGKNCQDVYNEVGAEVVFCYSIRVLD